MTGILPGPATVALACTCAATSSAVPNRPAPVLAAEAQPQPKGRDITYRTTPGGLVIELEGLRLEPKAVVVNKANGWEVKFSVRAESTDHHQHRFLTSVDGPLMVAAEIERGGEKQRFRDERKGDTETVIGAHESTTFVREVKHAIAAGQSLTLYVGLWGLGRDAEDRKPVRKLFELKMTAGQKKPEPVLTPPE